MPSQAWEALEWERLQRASEDSAYRDEALRAKGIVRSARLSHVGMECMLPGRDGDACRCRGFSMRALLLALHASTAPEL